MRLFKTFFGCLQSCADLNGKRYPEDDLRSSYCSKCGLVAFYASEHNPGKFYAYFYPNEPESEIQNWLHTSMGSLRVDGSTFTIATIHSVYEFREDEAAVPEEDRAVLFLNAFA